MRQDGRSCGGCTLCCKVLGIDALSKPKGQWCGHCRTGAGCAIYSERPQECRAFDCLYISGPQLGDHWLPSRCKMVVCVNDAVGRIEVHVDGGRPGAWRTEPYYAELKGWARAAAADGGQILICLPDRTIVMLPDKDVDLGRMEADDRIEVVQSAAGIAVRKVKAADIA